MKSQVFFFSGLVSLIIIGGASGRQGDGTARVWKSATWGGGRSTARARV